MIDKQSLTSDWIDLKRQTYRKADPSIMERMIFALYLLEQLKLAGLNFVFKGGTCLSLLMKNAKRFSIDLDIILQPDSKQSEIEAILGKVLQGQVFLRFNLDQKRSFKPGVPKAHYQFIYNSAAINREQDILLDILFEDNHYPVVLQTPIANEWLQQTGEPLLISTPDVNGILGDKLTAFAPTTTGVPYGADKQREIIKQLFDIGELFDSIDNLETVKSSFTAIASIEIGYRVNRQLTIADVLDDVVQTGQVIANRENQPDQGKIWFDELTEGISQFRNFLYTGSFRIEEAQLASAKAAYLASMVKTDFKGPIQRFNNSIPKESYLIQHPQYNFLNKKLKNVQGGCLFYWNEALKLIFPIQ